MLKEIEKWLQVNKSLNLLHNYRCISFVTCTLFYMFGLLPQFLTIVNFNGTHSATRSKPSRKSKFYNKNFLSIHGTHSETRSKPSRNSNTNNKQTK